MVSEYKNSGDSIHIISNKVVYFIWFFLCLSSIFSFYNTDFDKIFYLSKFFLFFLFIFLLFLRQSGNYRKLSKINVFIIYFLFASGIISLINSNGSYSHALFILISISIGISSITVFNNLKQADYYIVIKILLGVLIMTVLIPSLFHYFSSTSYYTIGNRLRFTGPFNNPNELALFSSLSFLIALRLLGSINNKKDILSLTLIMIVSVFITLLSDSRGGILLISSASSLFVLNIFSNKFKKSFYIFVIINIITFFIISLFIVYYNNTLINFNYINELSSGRLNIWNEIFQGLSLSEFLLGSGGVSRNGLVASQVITNGYIELLKSFGLIGGLIWFLLITKLLIEKIRNTKRKPTLSKLGGISIILGMLIYYIIEGGIVSIGNIVSIYFWIELSQSKI